MANRFWIGNAGNWNDTAHWSLTSGGTGGAAVPGTTDDVYFDANSFTTTGQIVALSKASPCNVFCHDINWTGALYNPTLYFDWNNVTGNNKDTTLAVSGNVIFINNMIISIDPGGSSSKTIVFEGSNQTLTAPISNPLLDYQIQTAGTFDLLSNIVSGQSFYLVNSIGGDWIFNTNNFNITCDYFGGTIDADDAIVNLGSSTITTGNHADSFAFYEAIGSGALFTFNAGTSHIICNDGATANDFGGGDYPMVFYDVTLSNSGGSVHHYLQSLTSTFHTLTIEAGSYIQTEHGVTFTVDSLVLNGSAGNHVKFESETPSDPTTITANSTNIKFTDAAGQTAGGLASPFIDWFGVDNGNNTDWVFKYNAGSGFSKLSDPHLKSVSNPAPKLQSVMTSKSEDKVIVDSAPKLEKIIS